MSWLDRAARRFADALRRRTRRRLLEPPSPAPKRYIDVRIAAGLFEDVRSHVERFRLGEEAGFLVCSLSRLDDRDVLLAREWHPIPDSAIERNAHGSVLSWSSQFNSAVLQRAVDLDATPVRHDAPRPR